MKRCHVCMDLVADDAKFCKNGHHHTFQHEPTKDEIKRACERIRATWSPAEEQLRRAPAYRTYTPEIENVRLGEVSTKSNDYI